MDYEGVAGVLDVVGYLHVSQGFNTHMFDQGTLVLESVSLA